jgi:hypothetical protein
MSYKTSRTSEIAPTESSKLGIKPLPGNQRSSLAGSVRKKARMKFHRIKITEEEDAIICNNNNTTTPGIVIKKRIQSNL